MAATRFSPFRLRRTVCLSVTAAILASAVLLPAAPEAKDAKAAPEAKEAKKDEKKEGEKEKIPPPEELTLPTNDGVQLAVTYYPGTKGKDSVPVILLHGWKGNRSDWGSLPAFLQAQGHAVLVPDLRGHGDSKHVKWGTRETTLEAETLPTTQFAKMVSSDMETLKNFLREKNNAKELNINKLCVGGAEMGALVATEFAFSDSNVAMGGFYGAIQVGKFVKALVLISPEEASHGLKIQTALRDPYIRSQVSMLLVVGKDRSKELKAAERIHNQLKNFHPTPAKEKEAEEKDLFFGRLNTSLQGTKLLTAEGFDLKKQIAKFIELRLVKCKKAETFKWDERKRNPHER